MAAEMPASPLSAAEAPAAVEKLSVLLAVTPMVEACTTPSKAALELEVASPRAAAAAGVPGPMAEGLTLRVLVMVAARLKLPPAVTLALLARLAVAVASVEPKLKLPTGATVAMVVLVSPSAVR